MTNSIKYILQKKGVPQQDLPDRAEDRGIVSFETRKKYISRWVLGERKIPEELIHKWAVYLNVDEKYIANVSGKKKGYVRKLNEAELAELNEYLQDNQFPNVCEELQNTPAVIRAERESLLRRGVRMLKKEIHENIYKIDDSKNVDSLEEVLDIRESNLYFYETVCRLHKKINSDEWATIFRALAYIADNTSLDDVTEGLSYEIYKLILENREEVQKKNKELLEYIETL